MTHSREDELLLLLLLLRLSSLLRERNARHSLGGRR